MYPELPLKHALLGVSETLRFDLRKHGIGVTVVCPGAVRTNLVNTADIRADHAAVERARKIFLRHAIPPERVARLIADAIRRNRFLVVTPADVKALYFLKRHFPPAYTLVMRFVTSRMDRMAPGSAVQRR